MVDGAPTGSRPGPTPAGTPGGITFTLDVEDHRPHDRAELRFDRVTAEVAEWLADQGIAGTFFVVGEVAVEYPHVVRAIAQAGHEVGLHGWEHRPLAEVGAERLAADGRRGRELLEDLAGLSVSGFRAPQFSLTSATPWAADALADAGFAYSSSVLPTASPLFGFPGAPRSPFRWASGLVEFPAPLIGSGRASVPVGGMYFRVLPGAVVRRWARGDRAGPAPWLYLHPYDFDPGERFYVVRDANPVFSPLQWVNRSRVRSRVSALLDGRAGAPLGALVERFADAPAWAPEASP